MIIFNTSLTSIPPFQDSPFLEDHRLWFKKSSTTSDNRLHPTAASMMLNHENRMASKPILPRVHCSHFKQRYPVMVSSFRRTTDSGEPVAEQTSLLLQMIRSTTRRICCYQRNIRCTGMALQESTVIITRRHCRYRQPWSSRVGIGMS